VKFLVLIGGGRPLPPYAAPHTLKKYLPSARRW
jgi:hypothetical protein